MLIATRKAFIADDGKTLVAQGHQTARVLLARQGGMVAPDLLKRFANADEFFEEKHRSSEKPEEPKKRGPGRPKKTPEEEE